jgi:hypothetical protein
LRIARRAIPRARAAPLARVRLSFFHQAAALSEIPLTLEPAFAALRSGASSPRETRRLRIFHQPERRSREMPDRFSSRRAFGVPAARLASFFH